MKRYLAIGLLSALVGCAQASPQKAQIVTCDSVNAALMTVNALDDQGHIPASSKPSIVKAVQLAAPICGKDAKLLSTTSAAIDDLTAALFALNTVIVQVNGGVK